MNELEKRLRHEWDQDKRNAVRKTELSCTKKLSDYHQKMTELESEVARLKKEFQQQERSKLPTRKSGQLILQSPNLTKVEEEADYSSYLLEEIKEILSNPNQELLKRYEDLVRESNDWMKDRDLQFTFKLFSEKNETKQITVTNIQISNSEEQTEAFWSVACLQTWLDATKHDQIMKNAPFDLFDITWESREKTPKQPEPTTPSKIFSRFNDFRNSLTKSPLQHIRSVFSSSPEQPKSRRQLIEDKENQEQNVSKVLSFTSSAKKILLDVASSNIKLKRLCRKTTITEVKEKDDENSSVVLIKTQMLKNTEKIESIVHQMNLVLTENTVKENFAKSPTKAVKFLIE